jgi:hypothetical protein
VKVPNSDVNARVERERVDIGKQTIDEIVPELVAMRRVECPTPIQVVECGW